MTLSDLLSAEKTDKGNYQLRSRSIRSIRRAELSKAAFEAVVLYGLRGTTLEKVGEIAGVSEGVVLHHFKDKSTLLEAVIRRTNGMLSTSLVELYRHAETSYERLWAIIIANFHESIFNQAVCQAWVSLMAEVPHNRSCQRVQIANYPRMSRNFSHELKHFVTRDEVKIIAR
ncbi:TetR family transcriptional regulator [Marivita cryptomonadis]|uniref:TetR family transcriptional regulator n=1 Tax=Marivita cryptomonadis TaxID=505252 RepID=UPI001FD1A537|nr:TetR family transcriptional regulator [Marivita cryptomonadis]